MKTDASLGAEIGDHLRLMGVETPIVWPKQNKAISRLAIENSFKTIMMSLNLDLTNDSLIGTPKRIADMYLDEFFIGLDYSNFPKCTTVENQFEYDEMVVVDNISTLSNCEHHFVTIDGFTKIAYIPKKGGKVLGLSKINRIVDFFCRRPQIQERLVEQIFHSLCYILETNDVAVRIEAIHYCVKSRGVKDQQSKTVTTKLGGCFKSVEVRNEFLK